MRSYTDAPGMANSVLRLFARPPLAPAEPCPQLARAFRGSRLGERVLEQTARHNDSWIQPTPLDWTAGWLYLQPDHDASYADCRKAVVATLRHVRELGESGLNDREQRIYAAWQDVVQGMEGK